MSQSIFLSVLSVTLDLLQLGIQHNIVSECRISSNCGVHIPVLVFQPDITPCPFLGQCDIRLSFIYFLTDDLLGTQLVSQGACLNQIKWCS